MVYKKSDLQYHVGLIIQLSIISNNTKLFHHRNSDFFHVAHCLGIKHLDCIIASSCTVKMLVWLLFWIHVEIYMGYVGYTCFTQEVYHQVRNQFKLIPAIIFGRNIWSFDLNPMDPVASGLHVAQNPGINGNYPRCVACRLSPYEYSLPSAFAIFRVYICHLICCIRMVIDCFPCTHSVSSLSIVHNYMQHFVIHVIYFIFSYSIFCKTPYIAGHSSQE